MTEPFGAAAPVAASGDVEELTELHQRYLRRLYADSLEAWVRLDLTMPQLRLLYILANEGGQPPGALARLLGLTPQTVTGLLDRLVERGLAVRTDDARDRRTVRAAATRAGEELIAGLVARRREQLRALLERLTDAERADLARGLAALLRAAGGPA